MCNPGHDISELAHKYDPDPTHLANEKLSNTLKVLRNPNELPGLNTAGATPLDVSALGTGLASKPGARKAGRVAGLVVGAAYGGEAALGGEGTAAAPTGEAATSGSTAATGVAPAASQGVVGAAAPAAGTTAGMTVTQMAQLTAAIVGTGNAAYSIYAAKHAPKPPGVETPPPIPQPGKQPDFVGARKKNLFGDEGPFSRDSTFLTGPGGVGNTNIGRNVLLGS